MSYVCQICESSVEARLQQKRHVVKRDDGSIDREIPVCQDCLAGLKSGYTLQQVRTICGRKPGAMPAAVASMVAEQPKYSPPSTDLRTVAPPTKVVTFNRK